MNRSILLSFFTLACTAAPLALLLAGEAPAPDGAPSVTTPPDRPREGARHLSPEKCKELREQVRQASQEGVSAALVPASAPAPAKED